MRSARQAAQQANRDRVTGEYRGLQRTDGDELRVTLDRDQQIGALLPRAADDAGYYAATERKHFADDGEPGSTFTDPAVRTLDDVLRLAHEQRGSLDGDDREEFIARGADPAAFGDGIRYLLVETSGVVGSVPSSSQPPEILVAILRTKPGAPCSAVIDVDQQPSIGYGVIILGPGADGREQLYTAHPGQPSAVVDDDRMEALEGAVLPLHELRATLGADLSLNTRVRSKTLSRA